MPERPPFIWKQNDQMLSLPHPILAAGDDALIKVVFGAIVGAVWVIGAIVSAINKKIEETKRRQRAGGGFQSPRAANPPPVPQAKQRRQQQQQPKQQKRRTPPAPAPTAFVQAIPAAPIRQSTEPITAVPSQSQRVATKAASHANPNQVARLLRRPESLRAAFILNEVLSPPLSTRETSPNR